MYDACLYIYIIHIIYMYIFSLKIPIGCAVKSLLDHVGVFIFPFQIETLRAFKEKSLYKTPISYCQIFINFK